jgi:hypothetical protein
MRSIGLTPATVAMPPSEVFHFNLKIDFTSVRITLCVSQIGHFSAHLLAAGLILENFG